MSRLAWLGTAADAFSLTSEGAGLVELFLLGVTGSRGLVLGRGRGLDSLFSPLSLGWREER